jgi:SET domain-containing protein
VLNSKVFVDTSPIHGKGLFARSYISAGEKIGDIEGECTTSDGDYVLWVDEHTGIRVRSDLRYINHSDTPNAAYFDDMTVVALVDIRPGEEITHDYNQLSWAGEKEETGIKPRWAAWRDRCWLPWLLLMLSWLGMTAYLVG